MPNFTTRKTFLVPSFDLDVKEEEKMYRFLTLLEKSNVSKLFPKRSEIDLLKGGRPSYNDCNLVNINLIFFFIKHMAYFIYSIIWST